MRFTNQLTIHIQRCAILASTLVITACANMSAGNLFSHYSAQNADVYQAVQRGDYQRAQEALPDSVAGDILDNLEKGRVHFLNQTYSDSKAAFELSDQAIRAQQDRATVSVSETLTSVSSLAVNDNLNEYQPADYELGFLHLYLGLNYLQQNQLEGALIEMRRANQVQERAKQEREKELAKAQSNMQAQGLSPNLGSVLSNYPDAGKTLAAVQNAYLLYLSALLYEADNDLNAAYVDYRRALAVAPDNQQIIDGTMRVATRLSMKEDLIKLEQRYDKASLLESDKARVIVIDEQGIVTALQGWKQSLPLYDSRNNVAFYTIALPYYPPASPERFTPLTLNQAPLKESRLTDVNAMAQRDLSERITAMVIRQALRVWAKDQLRKEATQGDDVGNLVFNIWNTLTEQPDTRSWLTLPGHVASSSRVVEPGTQSIRVNNQDYPFDVAAGRTALVWISRQGENATIWHKQLGSIR